MPVVVTGRAASLGRVDELLDPTNPLTPVLLRGRTRACAGHARPGRRPDTSGPATEQRTKENPRLMPLASQAGSASDRQAEKTPSGTSWPNRPPSMPEAISPVQRSLDRRFGFDSLELPHGAIRYNRLPVGELPAGGRRVPPAEPSGRTHHMTGVPVPVGALDYRMGEMAFAGCLSKPTFALRAAGVLPGRLRA